MLECAICHTLESSGWSAGILGAASGSVSVILVPLCTQLPWLTSKRNEPLLIETHIGNVRSSNINHFQEEHSKQNTATGVDSAVDSRYI